MVHDADLAPIPASSRRSPPVAAAGEPVRRASHRRVPTFNTVTRLLDGIEAPNPTALDSVATEPGFDLAEVHP